MSALTGSTSARSGMTICITMTSPTDPATAPFSFLLARSRKQGPEQ
jgi:hypothetical protein